MDGLELCNKLKADERTSHIPIILLTAKADLHSKIEGLQLGADDYIAKPFELEELEARMQNLIQTRKKLRSLFSTSLELKPNDIVVESLDNRFLKRTLVAIEEHIADEKFSVEVLALEVGMSHVQLYRKLRALTGKTPNEVIRNLRLARAHFLLNEKAGNVSEVAYLTGFRNTSYFAKCFKEKFGVSPSEVK
jgi:transcriptional regulator GlxA family with amidase domain